MEECDEGLEEQRMYLCESSFLGDLLTELARAQQQHAPLHSLHEAYAVILEELDELWDIVRQKQGARDPAKMRTELLQVATMAWRTAIDLGLEDLDP